MHTDNLLNIKESPTCKLEMLERVLAITVELQNFASVTSLLNAKEGAK